ncbi:MAG: hypothetical protein ACYT04_87115, partial [Nostoc sp.]
LATLNIPKFFVGDRQGDSENIYTLPSYLTTDAAIFYKRDRFGAAINFKNFGIFSPLASHPPSAILVRSQLAMAKRRPFPKGDAARTAIAQLE